MDAADDVGRLLLALRNGERAALDELFGLIYAELRALAHRQLARAHPSRTLGTTALVHEAYLKLVDQRRAVWQDRAHFMAVAATAMRHILIDQARRRCAQKRGGALPHLTLDDLQSPLICGAEQVLALDEALLRLQGQSPRLVQVVELRFFGGLSVEEAAQVLAVTARTVERDWRKARAFLYRELSGS